MQAAADAASGGGPAALPSQAAAAAAANGATATAAAANGATATAAAAAAEEEAEGADFGSGLPRYTSGRVVASAKVENGAAVFAVKVLPRVLCPGLPASTEVLAAAADNRVMVYTCGGVGSGGGADCYSLAPLRTFENANVDEEYYALAWSALMRAAEERAPDDVLLAAAGKAGVVKVLRPLTPGPGTGVLRMFTGHGGQINELAFHPVDNQLLISASQDKSLRIWNVLSGTLVCIVGGPEGHAGGVLSFDVHVLGGRLATGGMDNAVKLWDISEGQVQLAVQRSYRDALDPPEVPHAAVYLRVAEFSTRWAHQNYVDCVRFAGDLLVTKSTDHAVKVWRPAPERGPMNIVVLHSVALPSAGMWFVRFDLTRDLGHLAAGNSKGVVHVWGLAEEHGRAVEVKTAAWHSVACIRMCTWSNYAGHLYSCDDRGKVSCIRLRSPADAKQARGLKLKADPG
mmetsp:Transcript_3/g.12  ORF Transcript_3/g.12 Transcript_3/m.12 type:complete len:457 (-) Transcript_3:492-1862(-)